MRRIVQKDVPVRQKTADASSRDNPEPPFGIAMKGLNDIGNQRITILIFMKILFEAIAVPAIEAGCGAKPHIALIIFENAVDMII